MIGGESAPRFAASRGDPCRARDESKTMQIASILIANVIPLYLLIGLGYIAGRWLEVNLQSLARVGIFIVAPIVIFGGMVKMEFDPRYLLLPVVLAGISAGVSLFMYAAAKRRWKNNTANLIGLGSVSGNTGYFGLPVVLGLFGPSWAALYLFMNMATLVTENTIGYYMGVRGQHSIRDSLRKVAKLPGIHALYIGLAFNFMDVPVPDLFFTYWDYATGAWIFIGMMLIGVALGKMPRLECDARLIGWLFSAKFVLWPGLGLCFIIADSLWLHWFPAEVYGLILVFTAVPPPSNLVAYAAHLNLHPEKAATAVLLGTLFAAVSIPAMFFLAGMAGIVMPNGG